MKTLVFRTGAGFTPGLTSGPRQRGAEYAALAGLVDGGSERLGPGDQPVDPQAGARAAGPHTAIAMTIPVAVLFFVFQKYSMRTGQGAVKE